MKQAADISEKKPESTTPLLDEIETTVDLRVLDSEQLAQIADEVRREMIDAVSVTGGHLGAGLGVVELTVALHHVFNTPDDKIIWDVGHQAYPHKILTGRRDKIRTLRQGGGLSDSRNAVKASTTRSAPRIPPPPFPLASAWPSHATSRIKVAM